jgi:phospholipase D1/2
VLVSDVAPEGRGTTSSPEKNRSRLLARRRAQEMLEAEEKKRDILPPPPPERMNTHELGLPQVSQLPALPISDDTDIGGPPLQRSLSSASSHILFPLLQEMRRPTVTPDCMRDPVADSFFNDVWQAVADNNTKIFRQVFRCQPDNEVKSWQQYKEYMAFSARFAQSQGLGKAPAKAQQESRGKSGPPGDRYTGPLASMESMAEKVLSGHHGRHSKESSQSINDNEKSELPQGSLEDWVADQDKKAEHNEPIFSPTRESGPSQADGIDARDFHATLGNGSENPIQVTHGHGGEEATAKSGVGRQRTITISEPAKEKADPRASNTTTPPAAAVNKSNSTSTRDTGGGSQRRRRRTTTRSNHRPFHADDADMMLEKKDAEELLKLVQGHLVAWPYDWLVDADEKGQFVYAVDQLAPLEI